MARRLPPDILRKSHAHSEGRTREREKRELEEEIEESLALHSDEHALLIDLDGVIYRGEEPIAGAAEAVHWLIEQQVPHLFVTNTTSRPREALVDKLHGFGVEASIDDILAPPDAAAGWLAEHACRRLRLLVPEATRAAFAGFEIVPETADGQGAAVDAVVVGDLGREWTFDRLNQAFRCLMREPVPRLVALGMTRYWHAPDGLRLDTAPFVAALSQASGVEPAVLGKPAPAFYEAALARLGARAAQTSMIGDDIRTDVAGARAAGLRGILVKTGKFRPADLKAGIEPDLVLDSIAGLPAAWPRHASG